MINVCYQNAQLLDFTILFEHATTLKQKWALLHYKQAATNKKDLDIMINPSHTLKQKSSHSQLDG